MKKRHHSVERIKTTLQIEEHLRAQEYGWKFQTAGLCLILFLVLCGAIGLFGDGIASKNKLEAAGITIEAERFYRFEARMPLKISMENNDKAGITVTFPARYLKNFEIASILPAPSGNKFEDDHVQYSFEGTGPAHLTFFLIPRKVGPVEGSIRVNETQFSLNHFIFP
jgi:hypothetical protein